MKKISLVLAALATIAIAAPAVAQDKMEGGMHRGMGMHRHMRHEGMMMHHHRHHMMRRMMKRDM
jgi:hypothetical protein